jgi:CDGSH-type Zn-finger protein/ferredoxin
MADATIEILKDGPLRVTGITQCRNSRGEPIAVEQTVFLCRCGGSKKKPLCDGTHKRVGFSGKRERTGPHGPNRDYVGRDITIHDNRSVCAHTGYCTEHSPEVFRMKKEPWIDPNGGERDETAATIKMCPSGALSYRIGQLRRQAGSGAPSIEVLKDGPYHVSGGAVLKADPPPLDSDHYTLCRCGASKNKPYCDGSHWEAGFKDDKN